MRIDIKATAKELLKMDNIYILCHRNPDGDTLGSGFGLHYALKALGKRSKVLCSDGLPQKFSYMYDEFSDFKAENIVSVDIASEQLFGDLDYKVDLAIDHHSTNSLFADKVCLYPDAAATCEIIWEIVTEMGVTVDEKIATCLYTGVATDTGCFKFSNVTPATHYIAAKLIEYGADFKKVNKEIFETKTLSMISLEREVLNTLSFSFDNRIAMIYVTTEMLEKYGVPETELDAITGIPRQIEGVEMGLTLKQRDVNEFKVSARSSETIDASEFCKKFDGGGHARAAGCTITGNLDEVKEKLVKALEEFLC